MSKSFNITSQRQIEALVSPVRQEIVDVIDAAGPSSAGEIGELLGRPQDGLYYHIKKLVDVGLLKEVGVRETARRGETVYDTSGRPMRLVYQPGNTANARGVIRILGATLRLAERNFARAIRRRDTVVDGPARALWGARITGWVNRSELKEINEHLNAIVQIAQSSKRRRGATLHEVTFVLSPLESAERRREHNGGPK